jgi:hypothetical protein
MRSENSKKGYEGIPGGLPFSEKDIRKVLDSTAGQQLFTLLTNSQGKELQRAAEAFKRGDAEGARAILAPIMEGAEASSLVDQINKGE